MREALLPFVNESKCFFKLIIFLAFNKYTHLQQMNYLKLLVHMLPHIAFMKNPRKPLILLVHLVEFNIFKSAGDETISHFTTEAGLLQSRRLFRKRLNI